MIRRSIFATLSIILFATPSAAAERAIYIVLKNATPKFTAEATIEGGPIEGKVNFSVKGDALQYRFTVPSNRWFSFVTVTVVWKNCYDRDDGKKEDFVQKLSLRIRRDYAQNITIPIYFDNDRQDENITDLGLPGVNKDKVYFRSYQMAYYFKDINTPKGRRNFKNSATLLFYSATQLSELKDENRSDPRRAVPVYGIHPEVVEYAKLALKDEFEEHAINSIKANSAYWYDFSLISRFMASRNCPAARLIFNDLNDLKERFKDDFKAQKIGEREMNKARKDLNSKCKTI